MGDTPDVLTPPSVHRGSDRDIRIVDRTGPCRTRPYSTFNPQSDWRSPISGKECGCSVQWTLSTVVRTSSWLPVPVCTLFRTDSGLSSRPCLCHSVKIQDSRILRVYLTFHGRESGNRCVVFPVITLFVPVYWCPTGPQV